MSLLDEQIALLEYLKFTKLRTLSDQEIQERVSPERWQEYLAQKSGKKMYVPEQSQFTEQDVVFVDARTPAAATLTDGSSWIRRTSLTRDEIQQLLDAGFRNATLDLRDMVAESLPKH